MTLNQIKYVIEIAKTGSINKASNNLFISQPVLSASMKSLEAELGKEIFSRSTRGIELTPFGNTLLSYIIPINMQIRQLDEMLNHETKKAMTKFTIVSNGFHFISAVCSALYEKYRHQGIKIEDREMFGNEALNMVSNNIAEIGLIRKWSCYDSLYARQCQTLNLEYFPITTLNIAITIGRGNPLYYKDGDYVTREMLKPYPMVMYDYTDSGPFADIFDRLKLPTGTNRFVTSSRAVIYEILEHCDAYYLNSNYNYSMPADDINNTTRHQRTLILSDCDITSEIGWVKNKNVPLSPIAEEAISMIRELLIPVI